MRVATGETAATEKRGPSDGAGSNPAMWASMRSLAYLLLLVTALSWSGNSIAGRFAAGSVSPEVLTTLRWTIAVAVMLPFAWRHLRNDWSVLRANWKRLAVLGACGFTIFNVLLYSSLERTTAINVVLVQAALPALVFAFNYLVNGRQTVPLQIVGFTLSLAGVGLVVLGSGEGVASVGMGELLALAAVVLYAGYTVALDDRPQAHWLGQLFVMGCAAWVVSLPFLAWDVLSGSANWPDDRAGIVVTIYAGVFPALIAQACFIRGIALIGANRAGLMVNLVPILGTLLAVVLLGEAFRWYHAAALILAMGGIALAEWAVARRETEGAAVPEPAE